MKIQESRSKERISGKIGTIMIGLLVVEYILGMINNLYVTFPEAGTEAQMWEFAWRQFSTAFHIGLGALLLLAGLFIFLRAMRSGNRSWTLVSGIGFLAIFIAGYSGARFIPAQQASYSLSMAVAFLIALLSYVWGLLDSQRIPLQNP